MIVPLYIPIEQEYGMRVPDCWAGISISFTPVGSRISNRSNLGMISASEQERTFFETMRKVTGTPALACTTFGS